MLNLDLTKLEGFIPQDYLSPVSYTHLGAGFQFFEQAVLGHTVPVVHSRSLLPCSASIDHGLSFF